MLLLLIFNILLCFKICPFSFSFSKIEIIFCPKYQKLAFIESGVFSAGTNKTLEYFFRVLAKLVYRHTAAYSTGAVAHFSNLNFYGIKVLKIKGDTLFYREMNEDLKSLLVLVKEFFQ